jgi:hypothetical protein
MKNFILVHHWEYNQTCYLIECNSTVEGIEANIHSVCEIVGIDFDENEGESITIEEVTEIKTVIL